MNAVHFLGLFFFVSLISLYLYLLSVHFFVLKAIHIHYVFQLHRMDLTMAERLLSSTWALGRQT